MKMKLSEIKVPEEFKHSVPSLGKYEKCCKYYKETGNQDRYIVVDENNVLLDGYIMYLVLLNNDVDCGEVKRLTLRNHCYTYKKRARYGRIVPPERPITYKDKPTVYIYGKHPNNKVDKEYVWRLPQTWTDMEKVLQEGDLIYCKTKFGASKIVVTKIIKRDNWDTDLQVKKVCAKKIIRDGKLIKYGKDNEIEDETNNV